MRGDSWATLFERASEYGVTESAITDVLARRREDREDGDGGEDDGRFDRTDGSPGIDADPMARIVADADVLASDLLVGEASRDALDRVRAHDWVRLVASEPLLADAESVIRELADDALAAAWRDRIDDLATVVEHPAGDHPALASALHGNARHVLSLDEGLQSVGAGAAIRRTANVETSVRSPDAFARLFDPASVYEAIYGEAFPGSDRDA